jgi:hypothetical protein
MPFFDQKGTSIVRIGATKDFGGCDMVLLQVAIWELSFDGDRVTSTPHLHLPRGS